MKLSKEKIKDIAGSLECGMVCYVNKETKEVKSIVDVDDMYGDTEIWEEELDEIEKNRGLYKKIEKMSSRESFSIMEDFAEQVTDKKLQKRLIYALNRGKPFKNFKYEIEYDGEYRQAWFDFKSKRYQEWVKQELEYLNNEEE